MKLIYKKSQSYVKPELIDTTSSKKYVYLRKDITEIQQEESVVYEYDEAKLTKDEYKQYLLELNSKDILDTIESLKTENEMLTEQIDMFTMCLIEMSELVYA